MVTQAMVPRDLRRAGPGHPGARDIVRDVQRLGIDVRAGLHTGEIELVGDDIAGIAVHIAARIMAFADAGEVLVSSTVRDLVVGSDLQFTDRGSHALKGVPGEWRLFASTTGDRRP